MLENNVAFLCCILYVVWSITHFAWLSQDQSVKEVDKAKLKGYWQMQSISDLVAPCSILSKVMQSDDLDILAVLSHMVVLG